MGIIFIFLKSLQSANKFQFQCSYALALQKKLFPYMAYAPIIINWDSSTETFTTSSKVCRTFWIWYFNVFIVAGVIGFGSCVLVIVNASHNSATIVMAAIGLGAMSILLWGEAAIVIDKIDDIVDGLKRLKAFRQKLGKYGQGLTVL